MAKGNGNRIGSWAFLIGVILAVIVALFGTVGTPAVIWTLVIIGLIVGLLNVADTEVGPFLMAGAVLVIVSALGGNVISGVWFVPEFLQALLVLFVPATIVVAIKHVFSLARN